MIKKRKIFCGSHKQIGKNFKQTYGRDQSIWFKNEQNFASKRRDKFNVRHDGSCFGYLYVYSLPAYIYVEYIYYAMCQNRLAFIKIYVRELIVVAFQMDGMVQHMAVLLF